MVFLSFLASLSLECEQPFFSFLSLKILIHQCPFVVGEKKPHNGSYDYTKIAFRNTL